MYKKRKFQVVGFPLLFLRAKRVYFYWFLANIRQSLTPVIGKANTGLNKKSGKYTCRALSQKGTKFRREARLAPAARALDGGEAFFGGSDAVGLFDGHDEDFAVADFACVG